MAERVVESWPTFEAFAADDPRRASSRRVPLGTVTERVEPANMAWWGTWQWELFWLPGTLEVIEEHVGEPPEVRLVASVGHRDYLDRAVAELDARDDEAGWFEAAARDRATYRSRKPPRWQRDQGSTVLAERLSW